MATALLIIIVAIALCIVLREGVLSPNGFYSAVIVANCLPLYFSEILKEMEYTGDYYALRLLDVEQRDLAMLLLLIACAPAVASHLIAGKDSSSLGARSKNRKITAQSNKQISKLVAGHISSLTIIMAMSLSILLIWHLTTIDSLSYLEYSGYLSMNDRYQAGFNAAFLRLLPALCVTSSGITAVALDRQKLPLLLISVPTTVIMTLMMVSLSSRVAAIPPVILLIAVRQSTFQFRRTLRFCLLLAAIFLYASSMHMRSKSILGVYPWVEEMPTIFFKLPKILSFAFLNIFEGGMNLSTTLGRESSYPMIYKLLSFSPLPSAIDKFDSVRGYQHRFSDWWPYNSMSEAYWFGAPYFSFFLFFNFICLYTARKTWIIASSEFRVYFIIPFWIGVLVMHEYPLRNYQRWLYISIVIAIGYTLFNRLLKRYSRALASSKNPERSNVKNDFEFADLGECAR